MAELENIVSGNKASTDDKYKHINNQLTAKTKEAKKSADDCRVSEKKAKELQEIIASKNKKISELENATSRLKLMKDHAKEAAEKLMPEKEKETIEKTEDKKKKPAVKCRFEDTGLCRSKNKCEDIHPKKTCQSHSKLGSCSTASLCELRHPFGVCFEWQRHGYCYSGDDCRNRHPIELARPISYNTEPFLGQSSPHREQEAAGWGQGSRWSPSQIHHHDLQGMGRW